jgi:hypothetical protein
MHMISRSSMPGFSRRGRTILAALLWYVSAVVLLFEGFGLLRQAMSMQADPLWPLLAQVGAVLIGGIMIRFIVSKACRKLLATLEALPQRRWWQCCRPGFLLLLCSVLVLGRYLSIAVQGHYPGLIAMATLDLSLATALLGSSYVFWRRPASPGLLEQEQRSP